LSYWICGAFFYAPLAISDRVEWIVIGFSYGIS